MWPECTVHKSCNLVVLSNNRSLASQTKDIVYMSGQDSATRLKHQVVLNYGQLFKVRQIKGNLHSRLFGKHFALEINSAFNLPLYLSDYTRGNTSR